MFGFAKKASLKAAAKNILEDTDQLVQAVAAYEKAFELAIASGDSEKGGMIITAATEDPNVLSVVKKLQFNLNCLIPLKVITNDLLKPYLSAVYPDGMSATIISKAISDVLINHFYKGDNTPVEGHYKLWQEVLVGIREWAGENWSSEGVNDPRFLNLWML